MSWRNEMRRVHWDVEKNLSHLLLYDEVLCEFETPSLSFWELKLPFAIGVQCSKMKWPETISPLRQQTIAGYFNAIQTFLTSTIDCNNFSIKKKILKKFRRIRCKKLRKVRIHAFMSNQLCWNDLEEYSIYCGWKERCLSIQNSVWNFPLKVYPH